MYCVIAVHPFFTSKGLNALEQGLKGLGVYDRQNSSAPMGGQLNDQGIGLLRLCIGKIHPQLPIAPSAAEIGGGMAGKTVLKEGRYGGEHGVAALGQNTVQLPIGGMFAAVQTDGELIAAIRSTKLQCGVDVGLLGFQKEKTGGELKLDATGG